MAKKKNKHIGPIEILKEKKRLEKLFVLKYRFITIGLFFLQWIAIVGFVLLMKHYYQTGEIVALIISLMALVISWKSFAYRLDYKQSFGYKIKQAIANNPMNRKNRSQRRAVQFKMNRRKN